MGKLEIQCLGPLTVCVSGVPVAVGGRKQRAVLATLILHANQVVSLDYLTDIIWSSATPSNPRAVLQVYVANLRRALAVEGESQAESPKRLESAGSGYRLSLSADEVDLLQFEDFTTAAAHQVHIGELASAAQSLRSALGLWRGPGFPDLRDGMVNPPELSELEERRLAATEDLLDLELALGDNAQVAARASRLVVEHPFRERMRIAQITALYRAQRQGEALAACRATRRFLSDELGADPGPEFREVETAVLRQDPALAARPGVTRAARLNNLPGAPSSFIGRGDELVELHRLVADRPTRLITLTGPGGTGKTRLALATAAEVEQHFPDGVCWVALDAVGSPERVSTAIADALGVRPVSGEDMQKAVEDYLRPRRLLLALDNFEHVLDAWPVVAGVLRAAPQVTVLVTSRTALEITGEQRFAVPQLELPPPDAPPAAAMYYDAVELFAVRARHVDRQFVLDADPVAQICRRLDGLPLAIELAAARTASYAPAALLASLNDVLEVLVDGPRDVQDRQRTLRGAIDWSYRLLTARDQQIFDTFAVYGAAPDLSAVVAVVGAPEQRDETVAVLGNLVRHSLLREDRSGEEPRFLMLQTVRAFAAECLAASGAETSTRRRHAEYFLRVARHWTDRLHGPQQVEAFTHLHGDRPQFDAALDWAVGPTGDIDLALRFVGCLWDFWQVSGDIAVPRHHAETALRRGTRSNELVRAAAASGAGTLCWLHGDLSNARRYHREALDNYQKAGHVAGSAWSIMCLAVQDVNAGQLDAAESAAYRALELAKAADDFRTITAVHTVLGVLAIYRGDDRRAEEHQQRALSLARQTGDDIAVAKALINLSDISEGRREWDLASEHVGQALRISRRIGDKVGTLFGIEAMAELRLRQGSPRAAARLLGATHHHRTAMAQPLDARESTALRGIVESIRGAAGPVGFAVAWAEGEALSLEVATDYALTEGKIGDVEFRHIQSVAEG